MRRAIEFAWIIAPIGVLFAFVVIEVQHAARSIAIGNLDYFPLVDRALQLSFSSWDGWVNWIHPVGLPWLIRIGLALGFDAARFGQALSIFGGVLGLIGTYSLAWAVWGNARLALVCQAFTATTGYFVFYAGFEGNDMLAAGLQILSLGVLAAGLAKASIGSTVQARWIVLAGLAVALAYLIRYTAMITAMASLVVLAGIALRQRSRAVWKMIGLYLAVVTVVTALQWLPSLLVTGSPLGNDQGRNVWFHVYGKSDFLTEWDEVPAEITVVQVFAMNPGKFLRHWWRTFESFWLSPEMAILEVPLKLFTQAGFIFLLLMGKSIRWTVRALLSVFVLLHLAALSLMRLDPRFLIVIIPALVVGAIYFFSHILPVEWRIGRVVLPVQTVVTIAGLLFAIRVPLQFAADAPPTPTALIEASDTLHAGGMRDAREVLSTDLRLQDLAALSRPRFAQANQLAAGHDTLAGLIETMRAKRLRFLIYDQDAGPKIYPALTSLLSPKSRPDGLVPIYIQPEREFVIYRLEDDRAAAGQPFASLEQGITLQQYQSSVSRLVSDRSSWDVGVYLYWRAARALTSSFKVFVHVLDENGQLIAQDDSIPVLWLYPTSAWKAGETVVDFHRIRIDGAEPGTLYTLQVGLYDETASNRLGRIDARGKVVDDKIVLQTLDLNVELSTRQGDQK